MITNLNRVDEYISWQNPEASFIVIAIRNIILSCGSGIQECIKHKIPFYSRNSNICYINVRKSKYVDLGFCKGYELSNYQRLLESKNRTQVKTITFETVEEIDTVKIREIINEAIILDEKYRA